MSTSTSSTSMSARANGRPKRPPVLVAAGFIAAFGATIATVVLTGLFVRAPGSADTPAAASAPATEAETPRSQSAARPDSAGAGEDAEDASAPAPQPD